MAKHLKIMGLSLLALVGVMALNASAAQAKWLLLRNGASILLTNVKLHMTTTELLVPDLALSIHCELSKGTRHVFLDPTHQVMVESITLTITKCTDLLFGGVCTVMGVGDPNGTISMGGSGTASMSGEKVLMTTEGTELANIQYLGEECPLTELDGRVSGSLTTEIANPLADATSHQVSVVNQNLFFGESEAELHDGEEGPVTGSIESESGESIAVHLVGL